MLYRYGDGPKNMPRHHDFEDNNQRQHPNKQRPRPIGEEPLCSLDNINLSNAGATSTSNIETFLISGPRRVSENTYSGMSATASLDMRHRQRRLAGYVESLHRTIRQTWSLQTMHPDYHDLSGDMPESYGQCVPSSYLLFNRLTRRFPREHFSIKSGRVLRAMGGSGLRAVIPTHVWMGWQPSDFSDIGVIDITADQALYDSLPPVVVASHDALLEEKNVVYKEYRSFNTAEEYLEEFTKREPAVRMRIKLAQEAFHNLQRRII